nr:F-box/kelch-repeat protein SKIP4 [Ipomoea batatas]
MGSELLEQLPLIPGLPNDTALFCLARVPRKYHGVLKCVSKKWRDLMCGEEWYSYRKKNSLEEAWIYALCRDKSEQLCCYMLDPNYLKRGWKCIQGLPPRCLKRKGMGFEVLGKKLYLLGGCGWIEDATDEVYVYDAALNTWNEAAPLSAARCYFACEILDGKLYAIGGLGLQSSNQHSWDTYDPQTSCWSSCVHRSILPDIEDSFVLDGKIYLRSGYQAASSLVSAVVFEPSTGEWQQADSDLVLGWRGPAVVIDETLFVLDQTSGTRLMVWQKDSREWVAMGRLSPLLTKPPCRVAAIGKKIFIIGKGLSTVVFDVENAWNMDGILVSSSVPKTTDDEILDCKAIAI